MTITTERTALTNPFTIGFVVRGNLPSGTLTAGSERFAVTLVLDEGEEGEALIVLPREGTGGWTVPGNETAVGLLNRAGVPQDVIESSSFWWVRRANLVESERDMDWSLLRPVQHTISVPMSAVPPGYRDHALADRANITVIPSPGRPRLLGVFSGDPEGSSNRGWSAHTATYRDEAAECLTPVGLLDDRDKMGCWWISQDYGIGLPNPALPNHTLGDPIGMIRSVQVEALAGRVPDGLVLGGDRKIECEAIHTPSLAVDWLLLFPADETHGWEHTTSYAESNRVPALMQRAGLDPAAYRYWHVRGLYVTDLGLADTVHSPRGVPRTLTAPPEPPQVESLPEDTLLIEQLKGEIERLTTERDRQQENIRTFHREAQWVSSALLEQAENRDWCSEYDTFVQDVNSHCTMFEFEERTRETEVRVSGWIRVPYSYTTTIEHTGDIDYGSIEIDVDEYTARENVDMSEAEVDSDYEVDEY